ncbi:hypothetical protein Fmac_028555 [Flemingia macrophylla]|uniref:Uncharacterized protein n=1 Tax=Flemingia macrophylla TaxID=520843 RepID=A0ABD1L7U9_9FABA
MTTILVSILLRCNLEWMSIPRLMLQTPIDHHQQQRQDTSLLKLESLEGKLDALVNLVTRPSANQKPASVARVCGIRSSNDHHTSVCPSSQQSGVDEHPEAYALQKPIADHHNTRDKALDREDGSQLLAIQPPQRSRDKALDREDGSQLLASSSERNDAIVIRGVHDVAIDTSAETRKLEGKLDALVNLVTQLAANQKPASVARVCGIRSSNDHHTSVCPSSQQSGVDEHPEAYAANTYSIPPQGVHDVATDTSAETRKLEGKLDALVNLVTQLAANQNHASVARLQIRTMPLLQESSASVLPMTTILVSVLLVATGVGEHPEAYAANTYSIPHTRETRHLIEKDGSQLLASKCKVQENDAIVIRGVHDVATDTSAETRKLEGKLDALVNLQSGVDEHPRHMLQKPITDHQNTRDKALAGEDGSQLLAIQKLEGKLDALVNLVTQLAANQKSASVARVYDIRSSNDHHTSFSARNDAFVIRGVHVVATDTSAETRMLEGKLDDLMNLFSQSNDAIVIRGVHDVATDTSDETRKLEGMLDALLNLVTQLVGNQKPASVARVCDIHSSNDNHTSVCPSSQQSGFSARNDAIDIRGVHDVATDTSAETRNLEGKQDALANLVTQLAVNQKPASVAKVCGIRSSNDHHTSVCPSSQQYGVDDHPRAYAANTNNTSAETRKLEGKLDALLNLVTLVAANQKPASVARVCGIHSSNDHHTSVCPSLQQLEWMSILRLIGRNDAIVIKGLHSVATDTSAETRKLEGKLDALVNLMTQLAANQTPASVERICCIRSSKDHHTIVCPSSQQSAANQKPASGARVYVIRSSNDHHTSVCHSSQQPGVDEHPEAYAANTYRRP